MDAEVLTEEEGKSNGASDLSAILEPKSVAVIGASTNIEKIGHKVLKNIVEAGFRGAIYPINPRADEILGLKAYPSVLDVPGEVDVAVIIVPARAVTPVIEECVQKEVRGAVIISSGFRDVGPRGAALEKTVLEIARKGGLRIIGPNCQGISNPQIGFCATWPLIKNVGNVSVISQSGSIAVELPLFLSRNELGCSKVIALGNKSDIDEADLIESLTDDELTKVIAVYTEGVSDGRRLMRAIKDVSQKRPVLILKGGKTEAGKRAVLAHTGALAGSMEIFEAAIKQSGGICVQDLEELCDAAKVFSTLPIPRGNKLLIITSSGGSGILSSDACEGAGLVLSNLSGSTKTKLRENLPAWCIFRNPLDLTGNVLNDVQQYNMTLKIALNDKSVDSVLLIFGDPILNAFEAVIDEIKKGLSLGVPVAVTYLGGAEIQIEETRKFQKSGIPVFPTPSRAVVALGYLNKYSECLLKLKKIMGRGAV